MDLSLNLKQELKLALTQEMKLSMNILQMSTLKLREYLEKEAVVNPAIEISYKNAYSSPRKDEDTPSPLDFVTKEKNLYDVLEEQIGYLKLDPIIREVCLYIIGNLDKRGYLDIGEYEIRKNLSISQKTLSQAFEVVHSLEPLGVGAKDLRDSLKIQLRAKRYEDEKLFLVIDEYLEDIAQGEFKKVGEEIGESEEKIREYLATIRTLSPIPARGYVVDTSSTYIVPEATVEIVEGELVFKINEDNIPKINIDSTYGDNIKKASLYKAINIIKALEKRYETLRRILEVLTKRQRDFFFKGEDYLNTLILKDVADELDLHESTISRAIRDKYLKTPRGTILMKSLFVLDSNTIKIKKLIEEIVEKEDKKRPYSDSKLEIILKNSGYDVARRTVAKYRQELGIGSTRERKR